jgi:hypothetical protein
MLDEMERLRQVRPLFALLGAYHERSAGDRLAWQERVREAGGVAGRDLVRLHGELLAYGWIEQNTGATATTAAGTAACYRITAAGVRALRQAREEQPAPA